MPRQTRKNDNPRRFPHSEDAILQCLAKYFDNSHPGLHLCRGDDCAIIKKGSDICVSSDLFLEDVHFRRSYFAAGDVGHKALAANISDLAACGAKPLAFTLCLGLPAWADMDWLDAFFAGMSELAHKHRMALAGGDLSRSQSLHISIAVFGENLEGCGFLRRGGSMPGDILFVIGPIGLARVGLFELEASGREAIAIWPAACSAHLRPEPQVGAGLMLARAGHNSRPPALMDLSDGILRDLPRLLGQNGELGSHSKTLGANLDVPLAMLHGEILAHAAKYGQDPVLEALAGGEDYALLGACAPDMLAALNAAIPGFQPIGEITADGAIICNGKPIPAEAGFDHFENEC